MKTVEVCFWRVRDHLGKNRTTRFRMTREEALRKDPEATPAGGNEVRQLPDSPEELAAAYRPSRHAMLAEPRRYYGPGGEELPPSPAPDPSGGVRAS